MSKISICIPTTELLYSNGEEMGVYMLRFLLKTIEKQTFKGFEVIISDHSKNDKIEKECENWKGLNLKYFRNDSGIGSAAANLNYAISKASGEFIKTIFQDDFFYSENALKYIVDNIGENSWGFVGTHHCSEDNIEKLFNPISPVWGDAESILSGINTVSGPSVMFFKNESNFFDEDLCWLNDVEFYYRLFKKYGLPLCLPNQEIVQRLRGEGVSNTLNSKIKNEETKYVFGKHKINKQSSNIEDYPFMYERIKNIKNNI
jgi:glycosyltransferase involved in cell wall biosynthesis